MNPDMPTVYAGLLVGGTSRRMGKPKQLLAYEGVTFVERVRAAVSPHVSRTVLLGDGSVPQSCSDLLRISDVPESRGPLAGMLAALRWAPDVAWLMAACDLPLVSSEAVCWLLEQRSPGRWAVVPKNADGRPEPLLAVYEPPARRLLEDLVARGLHAPRHLADYQEVHLPSVPEHLAPAWRSVNTPRELDGLCP